jgi:hypothetical protein
MGDSDRFGAARLGGSGRFPAVTLLRSALLRSRRHVDLCRTATALCRV